MLTHYVNLCYVIFLVLFKANRCLNHVVVDAQNTIDDVESQTNVVNNGDAIPDISDIDFDDLVSVEIHGDEFDKGTPGMDYLGIGYDAIKGNTMGGEESLLDPGYRAPIINFNWRKSAEGYSPSLNAVYPLYGWVRPVYSCGRSSKIQEIENLDELKKVFSANASIKGDIPAVAFSASAKYKNASEKLAHKTERMDTTSSFMEAMKSLEPLPDTVKKMCSAHDMIDDMTKSECIPLKKWIKFFEMFGTHYVHQLLLGGKLIQTLKINASKLQALKNDSIDVDLVVSSVLGSSSASLLADKVVNKYKLDELGAKSITVIGGNMPNTPITDAEYAIWGNSVAENPMPIGIVGDSLKNLMDKNLRDSYSLAIHKYAELNGATYETLMKLENGGRTGLMKENARKVKKFLLGFHYSSILKVDYWE
uniref:Mac/perforin domain containing protein n=1 Tax=Babesia bovis TaxID=5865 RepID=A7AT97_BABBO|eukprot:XP_001609726.1 mac/perforin domain containing protein [Babesia bovis T2Bo]